MHKQLISIMSGEQRTNIDLAKQQRLADSINYTLASMEKYKMWFTSYKNRKDTAMSLVYSLVSQQNAANNMLIAEDMKRDSSSMNVIAALTMFFLPGTFIAVSPTIPQPPRRTRDPNAMLTLA